MGQINFIVI